VSSSCPGCGLPGELDGASHDYIGASPYCWLRYGELLAGPGEKQDYVDAYAAQHPGVQGRRQMQSVVGHLVSICAALEHEETPQGRVRLLRAATVRSGEFVWLEPPRNLGAVTVAEVLAGAATGKDWIRAVWSAWADHHRYVREWAAELTSNRWTA
jgi:hypothetical protein